MQTNSTPGTRFRQFRQQLGWKQTEFAERLQTDAKKISRIEKDVQLPDSHLLIRLGRQFGVRSDWLLKGQGPMSEDENHNMEGRIPFQEGTENDANPADYAFVPVYDVSASAGHGAFHDFASDEAVQHMAFLNSWIHGNLGSSGDRLVVIRAVGDSMTPTINSGDSLLIEVSPHYAGDGLYCVQLHETLFAKRVQRKPDQSYQLLSENPSYPTMAITEEDGCSFRLIGRILWVGKQV